MGDRRIVCQHRKGRKHYILSSDNLKTIVQRDLVLRVFVLQDRFIVCSSNAIVFVLPSGYYSKSVEGTIVTIYVYKL